MRLKVMVSSCLCGQIGAQSYNKADANREAANQRRDGLDHVCGAKKIRVGKLTIVTFYNKFTST